MISIAKKKKGSTKKLGGKTYYPHKTFNKKSDAVKTAKNIRKQGNLARVIPQYKVYKRSVKKKK